MNTRKLMQVNYDGISESECEQGIPTGIIKVTVEYIYEEEEDEE